jgi:hypothetical protein
MSLEPGPGRSLRHRAARARQDAGVGAQKSWDALVAAVGSLADRAIDQMLLSDEHVTSAAQAEKLLAGKSDTEALTDNIQRVVVLAMPVVRTVARGARWTRMPWVLIASSALSVGIAVRTGVRELQLIGALVAYRLEQAGVPYDKDLVKKLAIDLYLEPKRTPDLADGKLRLVRLTRKWVLSGALGRKSSRRARRALAAAEKLDVSAAAARWNPPRVGK